MKMADKPSSDCIAGDRYLHADGHLNESVW
jgi:hypothetical protein